MRKRIGRPADTVGREHITIMTSDEIIRRRYPEALVGLIRARQTADLNYDDAAKIVGVTSSQYGKYEKGQTKLTLNDAKRLADHFGVRVDDLF